jgi:RNA polymerase sigma-70 factor (ECF subfamily)
MSADPLDTLLAKLSSGDEAAIAQVFLAYEPYLRKVVRRQLPPNLRAKFDSVDVVQSAWVDVLQGFRAAGYRFPDTDHLRAFLVKATRNRFIDRYRQHHTPLEREERLAEADLHGLPAADQERPSAVMQADDLWQRMLALCPPEHHEVLRLKREGVPLAEIGARTGLHPDSIRRILRNLARQLAFPDERTA